MIGLSGYFWGVVAAVIAVCVAVTARNLSCHAKGPDVRMARIKAKNESPEHHRWRDRRNRGEDAGFEPPSADAWEVEIDPEPADTLSTAGNDTEGFNMAAMVGYVGWAAVAAGVLLLCVWVWPTIKGSAAVAAAKSPTPIVAGVPPEVAAIRAQLVTAGAWCLDQAHDEALSLIQQAIHKIDAKINPPVIVTTTPITQPPGVA